MTNKLVPHPQADIIHAIAEGKEIECRYVYNNYWITAKDPLKIIGDDGYILRVKKSIILIGDMEVPTPESEPLEYDQTYWVPDLQNIFLIQTYTWNSDKTDKRFLSKRIIHTSPDNALIHAQALIKVSGGKV